MAKNPFTTWTAADVAQHNARVTGNLKVSVDNSPAKVVLVADPKSPVVIENIATRQSLAEDRLNQTEKRFLERLKSHGDYLAIRIHPLKLRLAAHRCFYTPDFMTIWGGTIYAPKVITFWEVKGAHIWEDSTIKLKTAATQFPEFQFVRAQWKNGRWTETVIRA